MLLDKQLAVMIASAVVPVFKPSLKRLSPGRIVYSTHPVGAPHDGVGGGEVMDGSKVDVAIIGIFVGVSDGKERKVDVGKTGNVGATP